MKLTANAMRRAFDMPPDKKFDIVCEGYALVREGDGETLTLEVSIRPDPDGDIFMDTVIMTGTIVPGRKQPTRDTLTLMMDTLSESVIDAIMYQMKRLAPPGGCQ